MIFWWWLHNLLNFRFEMRAIIFLTSFQALYNIVESNIVLKAILYKSVLCTILLKAILYNIVKELCAKSVSILSAASYILFFAHWWFFFLLLFVETENTPNEPNLWTPKPKIEVVEVGTMGSPWHFVLLDYAAFVKFFNVVWIHTCIIEIKFWLNANISMVLMIWFYLWCLQLKPNGDILFIL